MLRGDTRNKARASQPRDFTGLLYGNITPTDIDALMDYHNKAWILIEAKFRGAEMPFGQRLALERMCDDLQKRKPTILIVASHNNLSGQAIDFANAKVESYRHNRTWLIPGNSITVKQLVDDFIGTYG